MSVAHRSNRIIFADDWQSLVQEELQKFIQEKVSFPKAWSASCPASNAVYKTEDDQRVRSRRS